MGHKRQSGIYAIVSPSGSRYIEATLTDERREAIVAAYSAGESLPKLAERYKTDHRAVRRMLIGRGVIIRPRGGRVGDITRPETKEKIRIALTGRKHSQQRLENMREGHRRAAERRQSQSGLQDNS